MMYVWRSANGLDHQEPTKLQPSEMFQSSSAHKRSLCIDDVAENSLELTTSRHADQHVGALQTDVYSQTSAAAGTCSVFSAVVQSTDSV